ncbi:MAG: DNA repair protein RecN [Legionellaceae bacterium]|nr:DNA repair protein RecN [Legionellaceae bacterium]
MLNSLYIENFAIVSHLELDFADKMTAFTGETGAGKSIMIDALMLALGERADSSVVRTGAQKCDIQARFTISSTSQSAYWLNDNDIEFDEGEVFLRRVIYTEGRSKSYINGIAFSLHKVKELSETLVDIHGQHQHQTLLKHATHRKQLDEYAKHHQLLKETLNNYQLCHDLEKKIAIIENKTQDTDKGNLLQFQIDELNSLALQENEVESIHEEHQLLHHAREYLEHIKNISDALQADDTPNVHQLLSGISHNLQLLPEENIYIKNAIEMINNALIQCDEAFNEVVSFSSQIQLDPERLEAIELRMGELHRVARKYHIDVKQLSAKVSELQQEQDDLTNTQEKHTELKLEFQKSQIAYNKSANLLSESRAKHAEKLASEITEIIRNLGMPKGFVEIEISRLDKMHPHGLDRVEYKVCTNPGMAKDSLAKIISGGELSRISLAIQMITAQRGSTPTLLFDEVDVGIGGATSALVGQLLRKLSDRLQVFCVTHQPQVAASAHNHFVVKKHIEKQQTYTNVEPLLGKDKVDEIARMLGGLKITEQTILHAEELLNIEV